MKKRVILALSLIPFLKLHQDLFPRGTLNLSECLFIISSIQPPRLRSGHLLWSSILLFVWCCPLSLILLPGPYLIKGRFHASLFEWKECSHHPPSVIQVGTMSHLDFIRRVKCQPLGTTKQRVLTHPSEPFHWNISIKIHSHCHSDDLTTIPILWLCLWGCGALYGPSNLIWKPFSLLLCTEVRYYAYGFV